MKVLDINVEVQSLNPVEGLKKMIETFPGQVVFTSSLGLEDQLITHFIAEYNLDVEVVTLDTGRLFPETYDVIERTERKYGIKIKTYFPKSESVENHLKENGHFSFHKSVALRKECCFIRKVEPLNRALAGHQVWVTGIRADQSEFRKEMPKVEWDQGHEMFKFHPILNWTYDEVVEAVKKYKIPYNKLHDNGFPSIGCQPCTRAVLPGEDFRAGRWWWERSKKECGLHSK